MYRFVLVLLLLLVPLVAAGVSTVTQVFFNVDTVVGLTLTLPGQTAVNATSIGAQTAAIEFNTTTGTDANVNPRVVGGAPQVNGTPIFIYDNTGTVNLNVTLHLNATLPACMVLKGATTFDGADIGAVIQTTNVTVISNFAPFDPPQSWYMKTNFSTCFGADSTHRLIFSFGEQT